MKRLFLIGGFAFGFVAGSRAGRGTYDAIERTFQNVIRQPKVRQAAQVATDAAQDFTSKTFAAAVPS